MLDDDNIEILDDDNNTSSSNFNNVGNNINNKDSKNLKDKVEQGKTNNQSNRNANSQMPVGGPNNGNQFKNSGNLAKISGAAGAINSDDPNAQAQALKNAGKEVIKPIVRKGVQAATGGAVGSGPVTSKIIDKAVDKVADDPKVDKIIEDVTKKVNKAKKKLILSLVMSVAPTFITIILIVAVFTSPMALAGEVAENVGNFFKSVGNWLIGNDYCANDAECQTKYANKYYTAIQDFGEEYNSVCSNEWNSDLISATIFYEQMVLMDKVDIEDEEDDDSDSDKGYSESTNSLYNYKNANKKVKKLTKKLYPNLDNTGSSTTERCAADYNAYSRYLPSYINSNFKELKKDENKEYTNEVIIEEILAFGNQIGGKGSGGIISASGTYKIGDKIVSNVMVRLMDNSGTPLENQELISLEKYVLGVVYGEIGSAAPAEQAKTQAIAARSFALSRPSVMNGAGGVKLVQENGQWILYIRNSTNDQVYCDPDLGCSQRSDGVLVSGMDNEESSSEAQMNPKPPLSSDASLRNYVEAVAGVVALTASGDIRVTGYNSVNQNAWKESAESGKDYTEILRETYNDIVELSDGNYSIGAADGDYTKWKQGDPQWGNIEMRGGITIKRSGCLLTAVAIQVARSGVDTPLGSDFNPGTLVESYRNILFNSEANFVWNGITSVVPKFVWNPAYDGKDMAAMSDSQQIEFLVNGINHGCYYVVEVKSYKSGQHWVAIDYIENGIIYMMDPSSSNVDLNSTVANTGYKYRINTAKCYQVK